VLLGSAAALGLIAAPWAQASRERLHGIH
jgi:hypothetical protein